MDNLELVIQEMKQTVQTLRENADGLCDENARLQLRIIVLENTLKDILTQYLPAPLWDKIHSVLHAKGEK